MAYISVRVEGLAPLIRELRALGADVDDLKDAMADIALRGAQIERGFVPIGSSDDRDKHPGQLRADVRGNRAQSKAVVTAGRASIPYAGAINFGWRAHNIEGVGFAQKVDEKLGPLAPQILQNNINTIIQKRGLG